MLFSFSALVSWLSNEANKALKKKETNLLLLSYSLYLTTLPLLLPNALSTFSYKLIETAQFL